MKISVNWLKEYCNITISAQEIASVLTSLGLEVESISSWSSVKGGLEGVIVGEVKTCIKHPAADKLFLTTVDVGTHTPLHVVCGASNVKVGQKVAVATIGTRLYKGAESMVIQKTKIRGELSEGMLCAEDELGLGNNHDGVMVLHPAAVPGTSAADYFGIEKDTVLEIGLTPNRIDSASHYGVARELAAYLNITKTTWALLPPVDIFSIDDTSNVFQVRIENKDACLRYTGLTISGVTVAESPIWLKHRLMAIGLKPINNVVDVTNYVLHELGQPLHAFDADTLTGNVIVVKNMPEGTSFVTLDEVERKLSAEDLMICDDQKALCMAGVLGGKESVVTEKTKNIFLESACFSATSIRRTARRHGINTDASFRFERGTDPEMPPYALKRAALLIREIAGGKISSDIIDVYPEKILPISISFSYAKLFSLAGEQIDKGIIKKILEGLEIIIQKETEDTLQLLIPAYRVDVTREVDVVEEILRMYGYNTIALPTKLNASVVITPKPDKHTLRNRLCDILAANGFNEIMCNSLTKATYYDKAGTADNTVTIFNPQSADLNCLRQNLLFGGMEVIAFNRNRKQVNLRLFEMGNCYTKRTEKAAGLKKYHEELRVALFLSGSKNEDHWNSPQKEAGFFMLKGILELLFSSFSCTINHLTEEYLGANAYLSDGIRYMYQHKELAAAGIVKNEICRMFDIDTNIYYADIAWQVILEIVKNHKTRFTELPKFPEVRRDLALLINKKISFKQIQEIARKTEKKLLQKISLFDIYENEKIGADNKSYAVSFIFQDKEKTLTDEQVDRIMKALIKNYQSELGATIR